MDSHSPLDRIHLTSFVFLPNSPLFSNTIIKSKSNKTPSPIKSLTNDPTGYFRTSTNKAIVPGTAPEKLEYGDIDILVDKRLPGFNRTKLLEALDAKLAARPGHISSFAIPVPGELDKYFRLGIHVCKQGYYKWETMRYSYGDLWHIISTIVTRYELMLNSTGLYIRVALQRGDIKRDRLLCLISSPREMMEFLGLDTVQYSSRFGTIDKGFRWCAASRLFRRDIFEKESVSDNGRRGQCITNLLPSGCLNSPRRMGSGRRTHLIVYH